MKNQFQIAVIGGSGKSGIYLVKELLKKDYKVKLLLRNPAQFPISSPQIEIITGNVADYTAVHSLLEGCNAIISTLGLGIPPSAANIFSKSTTHVIKAMNELGIDRYILTTGLNVDTPFDLKGPVSLAATNWMKSTYPVSTADKQLEYNLLVASSIHWTLVRLPIIEQTNERRTLKVCLTDCPGDKISATDLADFLVEQLLTEIYIKASPFIAS